MTTVYHGMTGRRAVLRGGLALGATALAGRRVRAATPERINIAFFVGASPTMIAKGDGWIEDMTHAKVKCF